jgi:glycosyltransferase involved in cell wall biosynthesis
MTVSRSRTARFAVIIPVYNHGTRIADVVHAVRPLGYPIVVVDDGSRDRTPQVLESLSGIDCHTHAVNRGKGAALITGMRAAAAFADYAITLDGDGQHDPAEARQLVAALRPPRLAIAIGRREMGDAPWTSRKGRAFSNFWVWLSAGVRLTDSQSGFRIYPIEATLGLGVVARRYQFEVEVLARAAWRGIPIVEAPISAVYGSQLPRISHFRPFVDFLRNSGTFTRLIFRRVFTPALWSPEPNDSRLY